VIKFHSGGIKEGEKAGGASGWKRIWGRGFWWGGRENHTAGVRPRGGLRKVTRGGVEEPRGRIGRYRKKDPRVEGRTPARMTMVNENGGQGKPKSHNGGILNLGEKVLVIASAGLVKINPRYFG